MESRAHKSIAALWPKELIDRIKAAIEEGEYMESRSKKFENELARLQREHVSESVRMFAEYNECEFCGEPATRVEKFDRDVHVCDQCSAEVE